MILNIFTLNSSPIAIFERFLILALCTSLFIWLYTVIRCKFRNLEKSPLRITIHRAIIEAALFCIIVLAFYFMFFVKATGWQRFAWDGWYWSFNRNIILMLLPEILILILVSILFFIQTNKLSNLLTSK